MKLRPPFLANAAVTLLELMVALLVIAVLAILLFPALKSGRAYSQRTKCASNLRNLGTAIQLFVGENNGSLPCNYAPGLPNPTSIRNSSLIETTRQVYFDLLASADDINSYKKALHCPSDGEYFNLLDSNPTKQQKSSYDWNTAIDGQAGVWRQKLVALKDRSSGTPLVPANTWCIRDSRYRTHSLHPRSTENRLYLDGHVEIIARPTP